MKTLTATDAGAQLPELLKQLQSGEEILLELDGKVVAKMVGVSVDRAHRPDLRRWPDEYYEDPINKEIDEELRAMKKHGPPYREPGFAKDEIIIREDFDAPLEDFRDYM